MNGRLRSWKRQPPSSPDEAKAARLLDKLGAPPTLPPETLARIERGLRGSEAARRPRLSLLPPMRPSIVAGGLASMAILSALVVVLVDQRGARDAFVAGAPAAARPQRSSETFRPSPVAEAPAAPARASPSILEPRETAEEVAAAAAPEAEASGATRALLEAARPKKTASLEKRPLAAAHAAAPPGWNSRERRVAVKVAARADDLPGAAGGAAGPARSAATGAAGRRGLAVPSGPSRPAIEQTGADAQGQAMLPQCEPFAPSSPAGDAPAARLGESDLMLRARCRLDAGDAKAARLDLEAYLARFPHGRFAAEATQKLDAIGR